MTKQCRGIGSAIKRLNGLATLQREERASGLEETRGQGLGRATNILWLLTHAEDRNHLVAADLRLTRCHSSPTKSRIMRVDGYTETYPALKIDFGSPISPNYGIWSLGCVVFGFCIWYLLESENVENFQRDHNLNRWSNDENDVEEPDNSYFITSHMSGKGKKVQLHQAVHKVIKHIWTFKKLRVREI